MTVAPPDNDVLFTRSLVKSYHGSPALRGVSLGVHEGEVLAIEGKRGSGKSTLMHLLGCLDTPSSGRMEICGRDLSSADPDTLAGMRNREIGFVFQSFNLLSKLDVVHNIELPLIYSGISASQRRERAVQAANLVGLGDRLSNRPTQLSGGSYHSPLIQLST